MDKTLEAFTDISMDVTYDKLSPETVRFATRFLVDSLACAMGAFYEPGVEMGRRVAPDLRGSSAAMKARAIGDLERESTLEAVSFVNSAMIRYLDFNDQFPGGHPSDALGPVIALADILDKSGQDLIEAIVALYEVYIRISAARLSPKGWDQGVQVAVGVAVACSKLLGLDRERTRHAISIAAVSQIPLRATRTGHLSLWKGVAAAFAASAAIYSTRLAAEGMSGPELPFEGKFGFKMQTGSEFEVAPFDASDPSTYLIGDTRLKYWPVEYNLQPAVWAALEIRDITKTEDIKSVHIEAYRATYQEAASDRSRWEPESRETADHSLPYVMAYALKHGEVGLEAFESDEFLLPEMREVMNKFSAELSEELEARWPADVCLNATLTLNSGEVHRIEIENPKGHSKNPMDDDDVAEKFRRCAIPTIDEAQANRALSAWWEISAPGSTVRAALDTLVVDRA